MIREIVGLALVAVGSISVIAHIIATGRRAAGIQMAGRRGLKG